MCEMAAVRVITISRQLGSGGDEIAAELAARLSWRCLSRQIIEQAARSSGSGEAALAELDELGFLGLRPSPAVRRAYIEAVEAIIHREAKAGDVIIVGRGGQVVLQHLPQVFHVKIIAPPEYRVNRLMKNEGISEDAAVNRIVASDRTRSEYLRQEFGVDWLDPMLYDLVINIRSLDTSWAVDLILNAIEKRL